LTLKGEYDTLMEEFEKFKFDEEVKDDTIMS
jgi:hypothetical protein